MQVDKKLSKQKQLLLSNLVVEFCYEKASLPGGFFFTQNQSAEKVENLQLSNLLESNLFFNFWIKVMFVDEFLYYFVFTRTEWFEYH